jgi:hypothetical protein
MSLSSSLGLTLFVGGSHSSQELSFELSSSANRGETRSSQVAAVRELLFEKGQNRLVLRGRASFFRPSCRSGLLDVPKEWRGGVGVGVEWSGVVVW